MLSRKALTNTSFTSVAELETRIDCWVSRWNDNPEPLVWTKPTNENPRQSRPRTSHPRPDHQIRDTPLGLARDLPPQGPHSPRVAREALSPDGHHY